MAQTKTLKDWPNNCSDEFFAALPAPGAKKPLDFSDEEKLYYIRRIDPDTGVNTVTTDTNLGGFVSILEKDAVPWKQFRGFHTDMENMWWLHADNPWGVWGIATQEGHDFYQRVTIDFYQISRAPSGWVFSAPANEYLVTKLRTWVLDYMYPEYDEETDEETESDDEYRLSWSKKEKIVVD